jgi:hypothetical protein
MAKMSHFTLNLNECDGGPNETDSSLDLPRYSGYISTVERCALLQLNSEVCKMLGSMILNPTLLLLSSSS